MIISDSPMIVAMAAAFANPGMIGGTLTRVGRERFVEQDGELSGLIDNRILVQASGGDLNDMIAHLEQMDFPRTRRLLSRRRQGAINRGPPPPRGECASARSSITSKWWRPSTTVSGARQALASSRACAR